MCAIGSMGLTGPLNNNPVVLLTAMLLNIIIVTFISAASTFLETAGARGVSDATTGVLFLRDHYKYTYYGTYDSNLQKPRLKTQIRMYSCLETPSQALLLKAEKGRDLAVGCGTGTWKSNVGALIIRIWFWGPSHHNYNNEPPK